jgi:hypothetical protein
MVQVFAVLAALAVSSPDIWGVQEINPTTAGGREWFLPNDLTQAGPEWSPETASGGVVQDTIPYFHTCGDSSYGGIRMNVVSPTGLNWWRDVEMTGYFHRHSTQPSSDNQVSHIEFVARSERHSSKDFTPSQYNKGVPAPQGTVTPPGYPYTGLSSVNAHCVGSSYHANVYDGYVLFEKEVTHTGGYSGQRGKVFVPGLSLDQWNGVKFIVRNSPDATQVHLELWLDVGSTGTWTRVSTLTDKTGGGWYATALDGCDAAPYLYTRNMLISWASPMVEFRADAMGLDFRRLSVREIDAK